MSPALQQARIDPDTSSSSPQSQGAWPIERKAPRVPASRVPSITGLQLRPYGARGQLANISRQGVLVRCDTRLSPQTPVTVVFEGEGSPPPVSAQVVRSYVAEIDSGGKLWFDVAIVFGELIALHEHLVREAEESSVGPAPTTDLAVAEGDNRW